MQVLYIRNATMYLINSTSKTNWQAGIVGQVQLPLYIGGFIADSNEEVETIRAFANTAANRVIYRDGDYTANYSQWVSIFPYLFTSPWYSRFVDSNVIAARATIEAFERVFNSPQVYLAQDATIQMGVIVHNGITAAIRLTTTGGFSRDGGATWINEAYGYPGGIAYGYNCYIPIYKPDMSAYYACTIEGSWSSASNPDKYYLTISRANSGYINCNAASVAAIYQFFDISPTPPAPGGDDPYSPGGTTGPGGGTGTHDPTSSDPILFNVLPEVSAVGTGFLSLWSPTEQQMLDLSEYMWNANPLTLDFWRRLIADPIQLIYGLNIIPMSLYDAGLIGGTESVVVGMINTGIKMDYLTSQWVELDCGTIDIEETWGAYLDYDPYTKLDIYLPYIGYRPLRVDDFMPGTIHVKYKIDLLTGACCAQISSTKSNEHGDTLDSVVYQFTGNCATQIPVTATQYADAVRSAISLAAAIGTAALLAGAGAPAAGVAGAAIMPGTDPVGLLNPPGMVPVDSELFGTMSQYNFMTAASDTGAVLKSAGGTLKNVGMIHAGASAAENVMGIKPSVQRSGAIGGAAGMLGTQTPYLIFTRPRQAVPENQSRYTGYPSFMTTQLSELAGFTQIQAIHLEGIPCTANELAEIEALLKSGVIF